MDTVVVEPFGDVWAVCVPGAEPQIFSSGAKAEDAAKAIAVRLASAGAHVEVHMKLRDGRLGGRFICLPPLAEEDRPLLVGGPMPLSASAEVEPDLAIAHPPELRVPAS